MKASSALAGTAAWKPPVIGPADAGSTQGSGATDRSAPDAAGPANLSTAASEAVPTPLPPAANTSDAGSDPAARPDTGVSAAPSDAAMPAPPNTTPPAPAADSGAGSGSRPIAVSEAPDAGVGGQTLHCTPGGYTGTFSGSIELGGQLLNNVTGTIVAQLKLDDAKANLVIQNARVVGLDQNGRQLSVTLTGRLNCASAKLEDGKLEHGTYTSATGSDTAFNGTVEGLYVDDPAMASGTWRVTADENRLVVGQGTWTFKLDSKSMP